MTPAGVRRHRATPSIRSSISGGIRRSSTASRSTRSRELQGYKARRAHGGVRQRRGAQPERARPVVPQREHRRRAHVRPPEDAPRAPVRGVQPAESHDLGRARLDHHEPQFRKASRRWPICRARCSSGCGSSSSAASARTPLDSPAFARTPNGQTSAGRRPAPRPPGRPSRETTPSPSRGVNSSAEPARARLVPAAMHVRRRDDADAAGSRTAAGRAAGARHGRGTRCPCEPQDLGRRSGTRGVRRCGCAFSARLAVRVRANARHPPAFALTCERRKHTRTALGQRG